MRVSKKYSSKYLRPEDLQGREVHVQIDYVEENVVMGMPKVEKDVVHFIGMDKALVLIKTTAETLAQALGDDSDGWGGAKITLYIEETPMGPGIRIRVQPAPAENGNRHCDEPNPPPHTAEELDDQIPF